MTKYEYGEIQCTTHERSNGHFQGKVFVAGVVLKKREEATYLCPEIDNSREDAMRRAIDYVDSKYPPE
jgi:hypothetical protein